MTLWQPGRSLAEVEEDVIRAALRFYQNNKVHTARALGICYKTLNNKLEQYNGTTKIPDSGGSPEPVHQNTQERTVPMPERETVQGLPSAPATQSGPRIGAKKR